MRRAAIALVGSVLPALYWWVVFIVVYADVLFAGDRNPAAQPPSDAEVTTRAGVAILLGLAIFTALSLGWRRLTGGRAEKKGREPSGSRPLP